MTEPKIETTPALACTGCGNRWTDAELAERRARDRILSCCPERDMQPIQQPTLCPATLEAVAAMHDDEAARLSMLRDVGMANHHRAWARRVRSMAGVEQPAKPAVRLIHNHYDGPESDRQNGR